MRKIYDSVNRRWLGADENEDDKILRSNPVTYEKVYILKVMTLLFFR